MAEVAHQFGATTAGPQTSLSVLYIFAGEKRRSDPRSFLEELLELECRSLVMDEIDILRDPEGHDVLQQSVWAALIQKIENGAYNIVIATPPCNTWSRAVWANTLGPKPCRSRSHPWGFPWLEGAVK